MILVEELGHRAIPASSTTRTRLAAESSLVGCRRAAAAGGHRHGHVDHGKRRCSTRSAALASRAVRRGITQHIGAYHVQTPKV